MRTAAGFETNVSDDGHSTIRASGRLTENDSFTQSAIDGTFGSGFYAAVADLPEGAWAGPVRSGYGVHVVRVAKREDTRVPDFEAVRERLEHDWRKQKTAELSDKEYQRMLSRYSVTQPDPADTRDLVR